MVVLGSIDETTGRTDEMAVAEIDLTTMSIREPTAVDDALHPNPAAQDGCEATLGYGDTVLVNPDASGFTYVYGTERCDAAAGLHLHLARVPGRQLHLQRWEYFAGTDGEGAPIWTSDPLRSARLQRTDGSDVDDGGFEFSVTRTPTGYRMIHHRNQYGGDIATTSGPTPWGPFPPSTTIYRPPEQGSPTYNNLSPACALWTYGAKEHVAFSNPSEIVISYNVNVGHAPGSSCAGWAPLFELTNNVDNYRPRFVRIPVVAGVPLPAP